MSGIEVKGLSKSYGSTQALRQVSVNFEKDKIYGLLGRNGAGKTTLLNIITNRLFADSGEVLLDGKPIKENDDALSNIYMMSEKSLFPEKMRVKDVFKWTSIFYPSFDMDYALKLASKFELDLKKKRDSLSTGYGSILKLITAMSVNVQYVFFDEPILGLDANYRDLFYRLLIEKYSEKPFTAVVSTHLIDEVSSIIEHVIMIDKGVVIKDEPLESILSQGYTITGPANAVDLFTADKDVMSYDMLGGLKTAYVSGKAPVDIPENIEVTKMDLQKMFIKMTNEKGVSK